MSNKVIISFSGRAMGNCARIAGFLSQRFGGRVFRFSDFSISPCGSCGGECLRGGTCPKDDMERTLLDAVCGCDEAWFIVPDYCGFPNANLFIYNERSVGYFCQEPQRLEQYMAVPKRFVLISNGSQESFRQAFAQHTNGEQRILQLCSREFGKRSIDGDLIDHPEVQNRLVSFIQDSE